jgi:hypothetical protein
MHNVLASIKTGSCESQPLTSYMIFKVFEQKPTDNELVLEIKNMFQELIGYHQEEYNRLKIEKPFTVYEYLELEGHEVDMDSQAIMSECGWTDYDLSSFSTLKNEYGCGYFNGKNDTIKINEFVSIGCLERILEHDGEDFFNGPLNQNFVFDSGDFFRLNVE